MVFFFKKCIFIDLFYVNYSINQPIRFKVEVEIEKDLLTEPIPYVYNFIQRKQGRCDMEPEFFLHRYPPYSQRCRHLEVPKRSIGRIIFLNFPTYLYKYKCLSFALVHQYLAFIPPPRVNESGGGGVNIGITLSVCLSVFSFL